MQEFNSPESRNEAILQNILGADNSLLPPESRIETLLQMLLEELQGGSSEVVVDDDLSKSSTNPVQNKVISANLLSAIAGITPNDNGSMELYSKNLNNITTSGFYNAMTCTNAAFDYMTLIVVGYYLDGYCTQIATDVTTGNMKKRSQINGTWTEWSDM
jgi:hypothetical protein